jgi:hypothetical protein
MQRCNLRLSVDGDRCQNAATGWLMQPNPRNMIRARMCTPHSTSRLNHGATTTTTPAPLSTCIIIMVRHNQPTPLVPSTPAQKPTASSPATTFDQAQRGAATTVQRPTTQRQVLHATQTNNTAVHRESAQKNVPTNAPQSKSHYIARSYHCGGAAAGTP